MLHKINHFSAAEFACSCCGEIKVANELAFWCDVIRAAAARPVTINSGFRCPKHNKDPRVGGSTSSRHMLGCAADLKCPEGMTHAEFCALIQRVCGSIPEAEIIGYPEKGFVHLAMPRSAQLHLWPHVQSPKEVRI